MKETTHIANLGIPSSHRGLRDRTCTQTLWWCHQSLIDPCGYSCHVTRTEVISRDRRGLMCFMGTWTESDISRTSSLNCPALLDNPPSKLPFTSFLSKPTEALLMCERSVMCCFQSDKCTTPLLTPLHPQFKDLALGVGAHRSWPFTTVLPLRTSVHLPLTCSLLLLRIPFCSSLSGVQDAKCYFPLLPIK